MNKCFENTTLTIVVKVFDYYKHKIYKLKKETKHNER